MSYVVGIDVGHRTVPTADRWIQHIATTLAPAPPLVACTHLAARPYQHVTVSLAAAHPVALRLGYGAVAVLQDGNPVPTLWRYHGERLDGERLAPGRLDGGRLDRAGASAVRPGGRLASAAEAAREQVTRRAGRAVVYPGVEHLTGTLRVEEVLTLSAIERVVVLDGSPPGTADARPDAKLETRDHLRPQWSVGRLTLLVMPTPDGTLVPFEAPPPRALGPATPERAHPTTGSGATGFGIAPPKRRSR